MTKHRIAAPSRLWDRTTKALGRLLAGMLTFPDDRRNSAEQPAWNDYPRFPPY
jgi:hypothetical protein